MKLEDILLKEISQTKRNVSSLLNVESENKTKTETKLVESREQIGSCQGKGVGGRKDT